MPAATMGKWGNSLAVRIPSDVAAAARLAEGDVIEVEVTSEGLVLRRTTPRYSAAGLFAGRDAASWRADYAGAFDWGPDVGWEVVPE